jgi:hypothetical protein
MQTDFFQIVISPTFIAILSSVLIMQPACADTISPQLKHDIIEAREILSRVDLCPFTNMTLNSSEKTSEIRRNLAEKGNSVAECSLGLSYKTGIRYLPESVQQAQTATGMQWLQKSADHGNPSAQFFIGLAHERGDSLKPDIVEAVKWYRLSAEQGHSAAQAKLGLAYASGRGVQQDKTEALKWYRRAADQGDLSAFSALIASYKDGRFGLPIDHMQAYIWHLKLIRLADSIDYGVSRDKKTIAGFEQGLTSEQIQEAKRTAAQWKQKREQSYMLQSFEEFIANK